MPQQPVTDLTISREASIQEGVCYIGIKMIALIPLVGYDVLANVRHTDCSPELVTNSKSGLSHLPLHDTSFPRLFL